MTEDDLLEILKKMKEEKRKLEDEWNNDGPGSAGAALSLMYWEEGAGRALVEKLGLIIAEVERLRSELQAMLVDHEVPGWPEDLHKVQDNPLAKKWHAAYRKAQNSNLIRAKIIVDGDARIAELEAAVVDGRAQYLLFLDRNPGCTAWNFDDLEETQQDALREQARYTLKLEEPLALIQLREAREQIKRLEAAFLEAKRCPTCNGKGFIRDPYLSRVRGLIIDESIDRICPMCEGKGEENAREELERIKEGGKDESV